MMVPGAIVLSRLYGELNLPVAIMAGAGDLIAHARKHAERLAGDIKNSDLRIVADQGHMLHYGVPEQVLTAIEEVSQSQR